MTKMSTSSRDTYRNELRIAVRQLRDRCLYSAAKWAAEQLIGLEPDNGKSTPLQHRSHRGSSSIRRRLRGTDVFSTPSTSMSYVGTPVLVEEEIENDYYLLAKAYFDSREYRRAAHVLRDQTGKKAMFLRGYALYLARNGFISARREDWPLGPTLFSSTGEMEPSLNSLATLWSVTTNKNVV